MSDVKDLLYNQILSESVILISTIFGTLYIPYLIRVMKKLILWILFPN